MNTVAKEKCVSFFDSGSNLATIKKALQAHGIEHFKINHILCSTDRGDQDLGYEISFYSNDDNLIEKLLKGGVSLNFPFTYQVRFTTVSDGEDFADEHNAYIDWLNDSDQFNRAILHCKKNISDELQDDERVLQFTRLNVN